MELALAGSPSCGAARMPRPRRQVPRAPSTDQSSHWHDTSSDVKLVASRPCQPFTCDKPWGPSSSTSKTGFSQGGVVLPATGWAQRSRPTGLLNHCFVAQAATNISSRSPELELDPSSFRHPSCRFLPSSRSHQLFDSRAETPLGAHATCPPSPLLRRRGSIHPTRKFRSAATKAPRNGSPWTSDSLNVMSKTVRSVAAHIHWSQSRRARA